MIMSSTDENIFDVSAGTDFSILIKITDCNGPVDLTGATSIKWACTPNIPNKFTPKTIEKTLSSGVTVVTAAAGDIKVALDPLDTESLKNQFYTEVEATLSGGEEIKGSGKIMNVKQTLF